MVSVLKEILNPKVFVCQELPLTFCCHVISTDPFLRFTKDLSASESMKAQLFLSHWKQKSLLGLFFFFVSYVVIL